MNTKHLILDTAIRLFNQQGTSAVSTNHIAAAAGISPGNLYYHYKNKEAIIRAIFEQLYALWDVAFTLPADRPPTLDDVTGLVRRNFEIMAEYQFIYREVLALMRQDAELQARYIDVRRRGYDGFQEIFAAMAQSGVIAAHDEATIALLADLCWLISEFWLASIEINNEVLSAAHLDRGIALMMQTLQPYLHP